MPAYGLARMTGEPSPRVRCNLIGILVILEPSLIARGNLKGPAPRSGTSTSTSTSAASRPSSSSAHGTPIPTCPTSAAGTAKTPCSASSSACAETAPAWTSTWPSPAGSTSSSSCLRLRPQGQGGALLPASCALARPPRAAALCPAGWLCAPMPGANTKAGRGRRRKLTSEKILLFSRFCDTVSTSVGGDARVFSPTGQY